MFRIFTDTCSYHSQFQNSFITLGRNFVSIRYHPPFFYSHPLSIPALSNHDLLPTAIDATIMNFHMDGIKSYVVLNHVLDHGHPSKLYWKPGILPPEHTRIGILTQNFIRFHESRSRGRGSQDEGLMLCAQSQWWLSPAVLVWFEHHWQTRQDYTGSSLS